MSGEASCRPFLPSVVEHVDVVAALEHPHLLGCTHKRTTRQDRISGQAWMQGQRTWQAATLSSLSACLMPASLTGEAGEAEHADLLGHVAPRPGALVLLHDATQRAASGDETREGGGRERESSEPGPVTETKEEGGDEREGGRGESKAVWWVSGWGDEART